MRAHATHAATLDWTLGDRMAKSRKVAGYTQAEMARLLEVSRQSVINYENDHTTPYRRTLKQWALATRVSVDWLEGVDMRQRSLTGSSSTELTYLPAYRTRRHLSLIEFRTLRRKSHLRDAG